MVAAFAIPASAAVHRGSVLAGCDFTVTGAVVPGGHVTIDGTGFQEGSDLPISVNGTVVAVVHIINNGVLPSTGIDIPADAVFPIVIDVPCSDGPGSGTATSTFADPNPAGAGLATTGSNSSDYVAIGVGAIVVGGVLLVGARRRSSVNASLDA